MMWADGVEQANAVNEAFASPEEAAAYWQVGTQNAGERRLAYTGCDGVDREMRLYPGTKSFSKDLQIPSKEFGSARPGVLLYVHGGGWVGGSIALNHRACRTIAAQSGWDVLSISYRFAPQHPFPAPLDDCQSALDWLRAHGADQGLNTDRIVLGGASAGGNLALVLGLHNTGLAGLLLFYPVTGADFDTPSYTTYAKGYGLSRDRMQELFDAYDPTGTQRLTPALSPMATDDDTLRRAALPPTCFISAECDVLADDTRRMAARLTAIGVPTQTHIEPGVPHGFINRGRLIPAADQCLTRAAQFLKDLS